MKFDFDWKRLTAPQKKQLEIWEFSSDPAQRIYTKFYEWTRHELLDDYFSAMENCTTLEQKEEAWESLESTLAKLRADYIRDLQLLEEIRFSLSGMFCPIKLSLQLKQESEV